MKPSSRQRVRIYSLILLAGALAVSWHLWRNRTLRHVDPASLEQTMGRWVRLQGFVDEFRRVIVEDAAGRKYLLRLPAPAQAPAGNLVSVTGRLAHLAAGAGSSFGTAELWDVTIVDLRKQPPPPLPRRTPARRRTSTSRSLRSVTSGRSATRTVASAASCTCRRVAASG